MGFVTIEDVTFLRALPSGKAFAVKHDGKEYVIPNFAVSDGSDLWERSSEGETGALALREDIAIEKGLIEGGGGTGIGIPLKRNRLPDPPGLMADERMKAIEARLKDRFEYPDGWAVEGNEVCRVSGHTIGFFDTEAAAVFAAHAPDDMADLLYEVKVLREWVASALKTQRRRRKK